MGGWKHGENIVTGDSQNWFSWPVPIISVTRVKEIPGILHKWSRLLAYMHNHRPEKSQIAREFGALTILQESFKC